MTGSSLDSPSAVPKPTQPAIGVLGWVKAIVLGLGVYIGASLAMGYFGVPNSGLFGFLLGGFIAGRAARAGTWGRWAVAFGLLFLVIAAVVVSAVLVLATGLAAP